ncbi:DAK2 domain-containing protein [Streptomyces corynorhini]|uniref:DAK2 domain-containing protein n=1 Tax=Streptomyces corynorhini TaxID=2282652 RepID=A0A370AWJ9_9ACTN|nr:DAK2 domain-containing protein [Streptomyces corynorhini]RDG32832.1 DAK2 domain-containing protein [Streptomyces corynorhini]
MTIDQARVLRLYAEAAHTAHEALTALDQISGDGDFGDNLREGLDLTVAALDASPYEPAVAVAGSVFLDQVGGTSGPLIGLLLSAISRSLAEEPDERDGWANGVREGLAAIQRVGEAEPGDRTMVDALVPARDALVGGEKFADAARAALAGAAATAHIRARRGRASYIGDRVLGTPDPGATGVALLFWALARVAEPEAVLGEVGELVPLPGTTP